MITENLQRFSDESLMTFLRNAQIMRDWNTVRIYRLELFRRKRERAA